jgi:hypothetical protein
MFLHPSQDLKLDIMYVDAGFAGMWHREYSERPDCTLSYTEYIITYCGCPMHWATKHQSENTLSTTESEYTTISMSIRELIPLHHLVIELHKHSLFTAPLDKPYAITRTSTLEVLQVYEDNTSCIVLAHIEGTKVYMKHISLKWHCFKYHMKNRDIKVVKINTNMNWADIFTKPS